MFKRRSKTPVRIRNPTKTNESLNHPINSHREYAVFQAPLVEFLTLLFHALVPSYVTRSPKTSTRLDEPSRATQSIAQLKNDLNSNAQSLQTLTLRHALRVRLGASMLCEGVLIRDASRSRSRSRSGSCAHCQCENKKRKQKRRITKTAVPPTHNAFKHSDSDTVASLARRIVSCEVVAQRQDQGPCARIQKGNTMRH